MVAGDFRGVALFFNLLIRGDFVGVAKALNFFENGDFDGVKFLLGLPAGALSSGVEIVLLFRFATGTVPVLQWEVILPAALRGLLSHKFDFRLTIDIRT